MMISRRTNNKTALMLSPTTHELRREIRYVNHRSTGLYKAVLKSLIFKRNFGTYKIITINPEEGC